jgi:hypothetical protein
LLLANCWGTDFRFQEATTEHKAHIPAGFD